MGDLGLGIDDAGARELASRFGAGMDKTAMPILIRRPGRVAPKPPAQVQRFTEEGYTPGALERYLTKEAGDRHFQVTVRTGREAVGRLPPPPEMTDRIQSASTVSGAVERLLLEREGTRAPKTKPEAEDEEDSDHEKTAATATEDLSAGMAGQSGRMPMGMFGPVGSTVDYVSRGLMGTGLGRTAGFLLKGRGIPEAVERRLGMTGAVAGLGLAALSHAEAAKVMKRREALMRAMTEIDAQRLALAQQSKSLRKLVHNGEQAAGRIPRSYDMPEEPKHEGMKDTTVAALVGGAGGAVGENVVGALRSRLGRMARLGASAV